MLHNSDHNYRAHTHTHTHTQTHTHTHTHTLTRLHATRAQVSHSGCSNFFQANLQFHMFCGRNRRHAHYEYLPTVFLDRRDGGGGAFLRKNNSLPQSASERPPPVGEVLVRSTTRCQIPVDSALQIFISLCTIPCKLNIFLFFAYSRPVLEPNQPSIQCAPEGIFRGGR
jgi:hypothetical protein